MWIDPELWDEMRGGLTAFRGSKLWQPSGAPLVVASPENRRPVHMPERVQQEIDDYFEKRFGIRFRQRSLFATGSFGEARLHGVVRAITPQAPFCFCWSPSSADLFEEYGAKPDAKPLVAWLEELQFRCDGLSDALRSGHEVMLVGPAFLAEVL